MMQYCLRLHLHRTTGKRLPWMGHFELQCTPDQDAAAKNLYDLFVNSGGLPGEQDIQSRFHMLCISLLSSCTATDSVIACPTDQLLFLYGVQSGQMWCNPAELYHHCGSLQVALQAIFIHMARMSASCTTAYTSWPTIIGQSGDVDLDIIFPDEISDGLSLEDQSEGLSNKILERKYIDICRPPRSSLGDPTATSSFQGVEDNHQVIIYLSYVKQIFLPSLAVLQPSTYLLSNHRHQKA